MYRTFGLWARYTVGLMPALYPEGDGGGGEAAAEALKKANFERDAANAKVDGLQKQLDALKAQIPTDDERKRLKDLEAAATQAEEDRKKKAGEWESLKTELVTKHATELKAKADEIASLNSLITDGEIDRAFGSAFVEKSPLFGGDDALTILPPSLASSALRRYVSVEMKDGKPVLTVKDVNGKVVIDSKTGDPMAFGPAMHQVINGLPDKDRILRGSGKAGSGSSGGGHGSADKVDFANLSAEQMRDPKIIAQAKERTAAAGGVVMGTAFDRKAAVK